MRFTCALLCGALLMCASGAMAQDESAGDDAAPAPSVEQPTAETSSDQVAEPTLETFSPTIVIQPSRFPVPGQPDPCVRFTEGFDLPVRPPCRPAQLQPLRSGYITATLISLPLANPDTVREPTYEKPQFPDGIPLNCGGPPYCATSVFNQIPSPIGEALFSGGSLGDGPNNTLPLDGSGAIYAYNCPTGTCQGFASQIWEAMPGAQKQAYLSAVLDGIVAFDPSATPTITVQEWAITQSGGKPQLVPATLAKVDGGRQYFSAGVFFMDGQTAGVRVPHWSDHLP